MNRPYCPPLHHDVQLARAKKELGTRYVLHKSNRVQRLAQPYGSRSK